MCKKVNNEGSDDERQEKGKDLVLREPKDKGKETRCTTEIKKIEKEIK